MVRGAVPVCAPRRRCRFSIRAANSIPTHQRHDVRSFGSQYFGHAMNGQMGPSSEGSTIKIVSIPSPGESPTRAHAATILASGPYPRFSYSSREHCSRSNPAGDILTSLRIMRSFPRSAADARSARVPNVGAAIVAVQNRCIGQTVDAIFVTLDHLGALPWRTRAWLIFDRRYGHRSRPLMVSLSLREIHPPRSP